ncbi:MAG TPA: response regulator transcription factor [Baekduia sp.]|nr:response regulator transcription factor [Baekduia sp.]
MRTRILIADPHPLYREALSRAIGRRTDLELVGSTADGRDALEQIAGLEPDVAVVDVDLARLDGPGVLNAVRRDGLRSKVVFLSSVVESALAYRVMEAGAAGYLSKDADADEICSAIVAVARGDAVLAPQVQTGIVAEIRLRATHDRPVLSERESEILALVAGGLTAPDIARRLNLSVGTVKSHLINLYDKLGVSERAAAVAEAIRRGLLE